MLKIFKTENIDMLVIMAQSTYGREGLGDQQPSEIAVGGNLAKESRLRAGATNVGGCSSNTVASSHHPT